jgi:PPP family 3-phenylpropionic acid transporter
MGSLDMAEQAGDPALLGLRRRRSGATANLPECTREANRPMAAPAQFSTDPVALRLGLFYAAYFFFGGVQLPFFPVWLEARGLDPRTIGLVIAVPMLVRIVATPLIAHQADRRQALKGTLVIASIVGMLGMIVVGWVEGAAAILLAYAVTMAACSPVLSLTDAYALSGLPARGRAYGPVRLWGSVAFIAGNVTAGLVLAWIAPGHLIWLIVGALVVAVIAAISLAPLGDGALARAERDGRPLRLWRNPAFVTVAIASSLIQGSHALYYGFSTLEWRSFGFSGGTIGALWGTGVAAEIVLFALSGRLPGWLRPTTLLAIGGAGAVPRERAASAQGFVATLSGIVTASATGLSGLLYAEYGSLAYLLMAGMAATGLVIASYAGWRSALSSADASG